VLSLSASGALEISRWCQPPEKARKSYGTTMNLMGKQWFFGYGFLSEAPSARTFSA
jgi:hypothetical protein